jgi:hypothetical protein
MREPGQAVAGGRGRPVAKAVRCALLAVVVCWGLALAGVGAPAVAAAQAAAAPAPAPPACAAAHPGVTACQIAVGAAKSAGGATSPDQAAGSTPVGYTPAQLQAAYALPSLDDGVGETVAVVAPYDDPDVAGDLAAYRSQFDEPACPQTLSVTAPQCFTEINESGTLITPGSGTAPAANASWALTTSSQLDAISAACPNCDLLLVEVNSAAITDVGTGVNFAVDLGAQVITVGVAQPETEDELTWDADYFDHPGIEITAAAGSVAAGDSGYLTDGVNYPAASQYVTAVGGTTLTPEGTGSCTSTEAGSRGWCEAVWDDSDGVTVSGCSLYEPEPAWQKAGIPAADTGCGSLRSVADVSADADPATGIAVYDSYEVGSAGGDWQAAPIGGTAVAAAIVAGAYALAGTPAADTDPASYPYANSSALTDITSGSNGTCSPAYLCTAGVGYDGPSGLGSPYGDAAFLSYYAPSLATGPAAFDPQTGEQDLFVGGTNGTAFVDSRDSAGAWSGWSNLSGDIASRPSVAFDPLDGALEVYARSTSGTVEDYQLPGRDWSGWVDLGSAIQGGPSAVYNPLDHALQVFTTGTNGTAWVDTWTPAAGWSGGKNMGGVLGSGPEAIYDPASDSLQVWGSGTNGTVWMDSWTPAGGWTGFKNMGGDISGTPSAVYDPLDGALEVYGHGPGNLVYEDYQPPGGSWSGWGSRGGSATQGSPSAVYDPLAHALEVYETGTTGTVFEDSWTTAGGWTGFKNISGVLTGGPDAAYDPADGSLDVYGLATNADADVDSRTSAGSWSGWEDLGGTYGNL